MTPEEQIRQVADQFHRHLTDNPSPLGLTHSVAEQIILERRREKARIQRLLAKRPERDHDAYLRQAELKRERRRKKRLAQHKRHQE